MLKLTEHVGITISLCISKKPDEILIFRTFIAKFWIFTYFTQKNRNLAQFSGPACLYDVITMIVLILVCMDREGPYLPIDTKIIKINFIGGSVRKI